MNLNFDLYTYKRNMESFFKDVLKELKTYNKYMSAEVKHSLESFDYTKDVIVLDNKKGPVSYDASKKKIVLSPDYFSSGYMSRDRTNDPNITASLVQKKINEGSSSLTFEELITFKDELGLSEEQLTKSVAIQELLKIIINKDSNIDEEMISEALREYYAKEIGNKLGITVSISHASIPKVEFVSEVKKRMGDELEKLAFSNNIEEIKEKILGSDLKTEYSELLEKEKQMQNTSEDLEITAEIAGVVEATKQKEETLEEVKTELNEIKKVQTDDGEYIIDPTKPTLVNTEGLNVEEISDYIAETKAPGETVTKEEVMDGITNIRDIEDLKSSVLIDKATLTNEEALELHHVEEATEGHSHHVMANPEKGIYVTESGEVLEANTESDGTIKVQNYGAGGSITEPANYTNINDNNVVQKPINEDEYNELKSKMYAGVELTDEEKAQVIQYEAITNNTENVRVNANDPVVLELKPNKKGFIIAAATLIILSLASGISLAFTMLP